MIELSISELVVIALVAVLVLKPEDVPKAIRSVKQWIGQIRGLFNEVKAALDASLAETGLAEDVKYIRDETGKLHRVYDISDFVDATRPPTGPAALTETQKPLHGMTSTEAEVTHRDG